MNSTDRPIANPIVVLREEFDDWAVLFNPDTADAVGTNPVGVAVWKLMDGRTSIASIVVKVTRNFENVPEDVSTEIAAFVNRLADHGFAGLELESKGADA
jgi:SynChlorMet cassette protein ScmD